MRENLKPFPLCHLKGSWREMGAQYGADCAEEITFMVSWWEGVMKAASPAFELEEGKALAVSKYQEATASYSQRCVDFMEGVAEGSGLTYGDIFFLNAASELMGGSAELGGGIQGCTTLAVDGARTEDGKTIIAQNVDWHPELKVVALRLEPEDGPTFLSLTFAGNLPQIGISSAGYGLMVNSLLTPAHKNGVPMYVLCTEALAQPTMEKGMERITMANRAMSFNYCFACKDGSMLDLETVVDDLEGLIKTDGCLVHTNHFQTERFKRDDLGKAIPDTYIRYTAARQMLVEPETVTLDCVRALLASHQGDPTASICCHAKADVPYTEAYGSIISAIGVIEDGVIYASEYPCQNEYTEYRL